MKCPICGSKAKVISIRHTDDDTISRKRQCIWCDTKWSSLEIALDVEAGHHTRTGDHHSPHFHIKWPYIDAVKQAVANV